MVAEYAERNVTLDLTPDRDLAGHAWVTLNGRPYYEDGENYRGFTVMLQHPPHA